MFKKRVNQKQYQHKCSNPPTIGNGLEYTKHRYVFFWTRICNLQICSSEINYIFQRMLSKQEKDWYKCHHFSCLKNILVFPCFFILYDLDLSCYYRFCVAFKCLGAELGICWGYSAQRANILLEHSLNSTQSQSL